MNHYELMAIISGRFADTEVEPVMTTIESVLKKQGSIIHYRQNLDRKKLAYPVGHQTYGYYCLIEFDATPQGVSKIEHELKLMRDLLRHLIMRRKTVGKPKNLIRQSLEQEAFGKRPAPLSQKASLTIDEVIAAAEQPPADLAPQATNDGKDISAITPPATDPVAVPPTPPEPTIESAQTPLPTPPATEQEADDREKEELTASGKKRQKKVSYEELDKKLDEILKDSIL